MKLNILAFGAHPDDVELGASGTILKQIALGNTVGIVDLTQGELGTRGSAELRAKESEKARQILGVAARVNLKMADGFFEINEKNLKLIIEQIRRFKPDIVLANAIEDRHPDHGRGSELVSRACFLAGLIKVETNFEGTPQEAWRPKRVFHYIQDRYIKPDFVVDVSDFWEQRMKSVLAYSSQFYDPNSNEPESPISGQTFLKKLEGRARDYGRSINAEFAEGFTSESTIGVEGLEDLI